MNFRATASDPCVYTRGKQADYVMLTLFVDDILLTGPSIGVLQDVQDTLKTKFSISELGPVSLIPVLFLFNNMEAVFFDVWPPNSAHLASDEART